MQKMQSVPIQEETEFKRVIELVSRNYKLFVISLTIAVLSAFLANHYIIPVYKVKSSLLIQEDFRQSQGGNVNEYLNSNLFGANQNFQNELSVLKSSPVIEQTIKNLDLQVDYYIKSGFQYLDAYEIMPFKILLLNDHIQPVNVRFEVSMHDKYSYSIRTRPKDTDFKELDKHDVAFHKEGWAFESEGKFGRLLETKDLAFILELDTTKKLFYKDEFVYSFVLSDISNSIFNYKQKLEFNTLEKDATVIEIALKSNSIQKGMDVINEIMDVYSQQNLNRKNHIASITIDYIERQLSEISDSLSQAENNLQIFRSSNQILNVAEQATGISTQYRYLQNELAELTTHKRYFDYLADYLSTQEDLSEIIVPASMGIQDQLLNNLISELISAQTQRSNLIQNRQERNPLVQKLNIQIENSRKTITENVSALRKTSEISIDEMNKRIRKVESEINRLPKSQQKLGGIERKYRLNDAIYNYLLEKRAEAKITLASNLPDNVIIEPATLVGTGPIAPNEIVNYMAAFVLGLFIPFGYLMAKSMLNERLESQENLEQLTEFPILGKIMHNSKKTTNVMFEFPKSSIAESYRLLRINIDYHFREFPRKVIMVTSSTEGEGKSFNALNLAMSFAQIDRRTILVDFDLRKPSNYFSKEEGALIGLSSYYLDKVSLEEIIIHSPHPKLDYISAGPLPPNPIELITLGKTKELLYQLRDTYDYIVLDTTPLGQVGDGYLLIEHADIKVVIARYNYSLKKVFAFIMKDLKQRNINNVCIVLNDNRIYRDQYGYGYGYDNKRG